MSPAEKPSTHRRCASLAYADAFTPDTEAAASARGAAARLEVPAVRPATAATLTLLTRAVGARTAVEVGTGTGVSSLALLAGMEPDGVLTSIDSEAEHQAAAREAIVGAGIPNRRARLITGAALSVLPKLSDGAYDVVFVDADPLEYVEYVEQAARLLRPGGVLILSHALLGGKVADPADEDDETLIIREALAATQTMAEFSPALLTVGDGLLIALRS